MAVPDSKANVSPASPSLQNAKSFAEVAIERGYCTADQISKARTQQRSDGSKDLSKILIELGFLTKEQAHACNRAVSGRTVIGNFEILEKVGQGGMGAVFRARQITMDRIVAIKILPPKLAQNPSFQKRFINEARVSAKLSHLNIINGIDCGEANGYTYFAMEYVDGRTIKEVMREKGKFSPPDAIKIVRQVVEALAYAKSQGLVHRDVKPDNIMLTGNSVAKLCDLGLAKHVESNDDASLTQSGQAVGTPHYISPEQARGEAVDFNSDIYSLGATFYHMLTGKTPFNAPTSAAVMALHIANDTRNPCDVEPSIPIGYGQVISRMMAKEKSERYPTPDGLFADLDCLETGRTPSAATFKGKTSCLMPKSGPTSKGIRGRTTGPVAPVDERIQTSARLPRSNAKSSTLGWAPVAALAVIVLVIVYFSMSNHSTNQTTQANANKIPPVHNEPPKEIKQPEPAPTVNTDTKTTASVQTTPPANTAIPEPAPPPAETKPKVEEHVPVKEVPPEREPAKVPPPVETAQPERKPEPAPGIKTPEPAVSVKFEPSADMQYARFLFELIRRTNSVDLVKALPDVKKLSADPAYSKIKAEIHSELEGVNNSIKFEQDALAAMGKRGGELELSSTKAIAKKVTIVGYDAERGLNVKVSDGLEMSLKPMDLGADQILAAAADSPLLKRLEYLLVRGRTTAFKPLVDKLESSDKAIWERKLRLLGDAERELKARERYEGIEKSVASKDWKQVDTLAADFEKTYSTSEVAQENAATIAGWQAQAKKELQPANPWKKFFHCTASRELPDGWIELVYDFEKTPDAAADFLGSPGTAVIGDQHLVVEKGDEGRFDQLFFNVPISELKLVSLMFKLPQVRKGSCRIGFQKDEGIAAVVDLNAKFGVNIPNSIGNTQKISWNDLNIGEEIDFSGKSTDGKTFTWALAGKELGNSNLPELHNPKFGIGCFNLHNCWSKFKIVFKPDLKWLNDRTEAAQKKALDR